MVKTKDRSQLCLGLDIFETKMEISVSKQPVPVPVM